MRSAGTLASLLLVAAACAPVPRLGPGDAGAAPGSGDAGDIILDRPDSGRLALRDGGASDAGAPEADAGTADPDGGPPVTADCPGNLGGAWIGTFTGFVWFDSNPTQREPVAGDLTFDLSCVGQKYAVTGQMRGSEMRSSTFSATITGEVGSQGADVVFQAAMAGTVEVQLTPVTRLPIPFVGELRAILAGGRFDPGTWNGRSNSASIPPASGTGSWRATHR